MKTNWEDLYSEVRKRKMEALDKKKVVQAVEKYGGLLVVDGKYEKAEQIFKFIYAKQKKLLTGNEIIQILKLDLNQFDLIVIGCPGLDVPTEAFPKIREFVERGGWILTTDWCIQSLVVKIFPGYIEPSKNRTEDAVVACTILKPNHPFLEGVEREIQQRRWSSQSSGNIKDKEFRWWLEYRSFPIKVLNPNAVKILIASWELKEKWGEAPILVYFDYGNGRVIHMVSHTYLQKGSEKDKYVSALILTNILDEKISQKIDPSKRKKPKYVSDWESPKPQPQYSQPPLEEQWVAPPKKPEKQDFITPTGSGDVELSGASKIIELDKKTLNLDNLCVYCLYDFNDYDAKIYQCKECGACYHENCLNRQIDHGICKKCDRILLW